MEIHPGAKNRTLRRCAWFMYLFLVIAFLAYAAVVFLLAYRSRNVPAVSLDYKVETVQLPNIYVCPFAFFSELSSLSITGMGGSCVTYFTKAVAGERATGLRSGRTQGYVNWDLENSKRVAPRTFTYSGDGDSDCEVEGVELPLPSFDLEDMKGLGSSMCVRFNTSRFSFSPELITSSFSGLALSFGWTLPSSAPLSGYSKGANVFAAFSDDGVKNGEYDVPGSVISGGGIDGIELSLSVRKYLNGSEKVSGSFVTTHHDSYNSTYGTSFPSSDYFYATLTLSPQGRLHITEKSPINWTLILSQIVAGWSLVTAVFGIFFAYDLRREWSLPWPLHFKEVVAKDVEESKDISLVEAGPTRRSAFDLYPST